MWGRSWTSWNVEQEVSAGKLDPIKVAGAIHRPCALLSKLPCARWIEILADVCEGAGLSAKCCGPQPNYSHGISTADAEELVEWGVLGRVAELPLCLSTLFQVPKDGVVDRLIFDCRSVNSWLVKPPTVRLPEVGEILSILRFFPKAAFGTADLRHYFYQIRLLHGDRKLFGVRTARGLFNALCLPMGCTWSPWLAQAIIMSMLSVSRYVVDDTDVRAESPPPFLILRRRVRGPIVAFMMAWIDNIMVVADSVQIRDAIILDIDKNGAALNAKFKRNEVGEVWTRTLNRGEYVGINFELANGKFLWKHCVKTCSRWRVMPQVRAQMSVRDVAVIAGRCIWHCTLHNSAVSLFRKVLKLLSEVSEGIVTRADWACMKVVSEGQQLDLTEAIAVLRLNAISSINQRQRRLTPVFFGFRCITEWAGWSAFR